MTTLAGVSVVDVHTGAVHADRDVRLAAGRIAAIGPAGADPGPDVVDARGRYLVPGFVDMHAHPLDAGDPTAALELMLSFGITGYRQMSGTSQLLRRRREGHLDLPATAPELLAMPGEVLTPLNAGTPNAAAALVKRQHADKADFVKVVQVTPDALAAAQQAAAEVGIPIVGHLPSGVDVRAVSAAGFRSIEHLGPGGALLTACSPDEEVLRAESAAANGLRLPRIKLPFLNRALGAAVDRLVVDPLPHGTSAGMAVLRRTVEGFDADRAAELAERFAADGTWHCPTLIRLRTQQQCADPAFAADPDLRLVAPHTVRAWQAAARDFERRFDAADRETFDALYELQLRLVAGFDRAGVPLLAGTDAVGAAWVIAGSALHREFDELARAGLTPLRILQLATREPARFLGLDDAGAVAPGNRADLVLLDADPTADHTALHAISGVVRAGTYHPANALDALRARVLARGGVT